MSAEDTDTVTAGTLYTVLEINPWPPLISGIIVKRDFHDGSIILSGLPTGQLQFQIVQNETIIAELVSRPFSISNPSKILITIAWNIPHELAIYVNNKIVGSLNDAPSDQPKHDFSQPERGIAENHIDYSRQNAVALSKRRDRLMGHQAIPGKRRADDKYLFDSLETELLQLRDLIHWIDAGRTHHIPGLAARLRMLVAHGDPLPLLQECAAAINWPLIICTNFLDRRLPTEELRPRTNQILHLIFNISANSEVAFQNAVDLDVWLASNAGSNFDKPFSHRDLLLAVGHTVGAHLARDLHPLVKLLRSAQSTTTSGETHDFLANYLRKFADVALVLGEATLFAFKNRG